MRDERGEVASGLRSKDSPRWRVRRQDVARAVRISGNGSPGPDGIPYKAWRKLGELGVDILHEAMDDLMGEDAISLLRQAYAQEDGLHSFNLSSLICLPKKKTGTDELLGDYYDTASTRPLVVVNTDNRLMANAARLQWEPIFNEWVSEVQRGFLRGGDDTIGARLECARGAGGGDLGDIAGHDQVGIQISAVV